MIKKIIYKFIIYFFYDRVKKRKKKIQKDFQLKPSFYLIANLSSLGGIFSNLKIVLNGIYKAKKLRLKPEVDMENFPNLYNDDDIKFTKNSWLYYFKPLTQGLKVALNRGYIINKDNKINQQLIIKNTKRNKKLKKIYKKYVFFKDDLLKEANKFYKKNLDKKKIIAVHARGTDAKITPNHNFPPTLCQIDDVLKKNIKKNKIEKIFLITDQLQYFEFLKEKYKEKICHLDSFRSNNTKIFDLKFRKKHKYKIGRDSIVEMLILSKINNIIYSQSNLVEFAIFHSKLKKIKIHKIENGKNSSNILTSLFLWKIRELFHENIGGFKKVPHVKKFIVKN